MTDSPAKKGSPALAKKLSVAKTIEKKARSTTTPSTSADGLPKKAATATATASKAAEFLRNTAIAAGEVVADDAADDPGASVSSFDAAEYDVKHPTGDKMRDKVRGLLSTSLIKPGEGYEAAAADTVGRAIEHAMFDKFGGTTPEYRTKYRELAFNFKDAKNGTLRAAVLERDVAPSRIVIMPSNELANEELKKNRDKVREKMTRDAMPFNQAQAASTNMFQCGKCKQRKCTYYQMQTRSADEPLTTFVTCVNCSNRWRF